MRCGLKGFCERFIIAAAMALATAAAAVPAQATPIYWSLFNAEGENAASAVYVTYATLDDMLNDTNRIGGGFPNSIGFGNNIVGSGAFVMLTEEVPEPATPALFALGLAGLGMMQWRRRSSAFARPAVATPTAGAAGSSASGGQRRL